MKAKITITPKKAVLDPQGEAVKKALEQLGCEGIGEARVGKYIELEIAADRPEARRKLEEACQRFLSNPVIEDYELAFDCGQSSAVGSGNGA